MLKNTMMALLAATALTVAVPAMTSQAEAATCAKTTPFKVGVSVYVGWQPWYWAHQVGVIKAAGAKRCLDISVEEFPSYGPSMDAFNAGTVDALAITNMDSLTSAVNAGKEVTAVIVGDYSDGNDAILSKDVTSVRQLRGKTLYRLQASVSDYLIERALEKNGMRATDLNLETLDDSVHESTFTSNAAVRNLATWNPMTLHIQNWTVNGKVNTLFTSHEIPTEIQDLLVVDTKTLKAHPEAGDALADAWYQATAKMEAGDKTALGIMAQTSGSTDPEYASQLSTTHMYYKASEAAAFTTSKQMKDVTKSVRDFVYARGLMQGGTDANAIGISFPDGSVLGNAKNVMFHIDASYMQKAASGK
jgi:NitT/TauT family transport system substrate-binding protein